MTSILHNASDWYNGQLKTNHYSIRDSRLLILDSTITPSSKIMAPSLSSRFLSSSFSFYSMLNIKRLRLFLLFSTSEIVSARNCSGFGISVLVLFLLSSFMISSLVFLSFSAIICSMLEM